MKIKLFFPILIIVVGLFGNDSTSYVDYFPLQVGNEWNYIWISANHGIEYKEKIADTLSINNQKYFQVEVYKIYGDIDIDTLRIDTLGRIWNYKKGTEQITLDFSNGCDTNYICYNNNDSLVFKPTRIDSIEIGFRKYYECRGFYIHSLYDSSHYIHNIYAPEVGLIKQEVVYGMEPEIWTKSYLIDDNYITNFIRFFPELDTITISEGCSSPSLLFTNISQTSHIDSIIITSPYNWFEVHNPPNHFGFAKCGFEVYNIGVQYKYEIWYNPIKCPWDNIQHIILFDTLNSYLGDFDINLKIFKENIIIDSLSHFMRAIEYMVIDDNIHQTSFHLSQNYPNPFNPTTMINYQLPMTSDVNLSIYNILGQKIATLVNEKKSEGNHQVVWDASEYSSGIYFYKIETGDFMEYRKCLLVK